VRDNIPTIEIRCHCYAPHNPATVMAAVCQPSCPVTPAQVEKSQDREIWHIPRVAIGPDVAGLSHLLRVGFASLQSTGFCTGHEAWTKIRGRRELLQEGRSNTASDALAASPVAPIPSSSPRGRARATQGCLAQAGPRTQTEPAGPACFRSIT
jgi:hypothetical protein